jgi:Domain of unknown function (DUF5916)/Carbohydrate family 9 binding domain-like
MHVEANSSAARAYIGAMPARLVVCVLALIACLAAFGAEPNPTFHVTRATSPISIDGKLDDEAWKTATRIDQWWETNVSENGPPPAKCTGWLTYDDHYFYAAFQFDDPKPSEIRGPLNDRDHIGGNTDDYGGVIIDARNDGRTGTLFLVNASGVQYDSVSDDSTGNEDSSPDFFWDSATRLTPTGWTLEIRIPFSSLRYASRNPAEWGIMLYRNYPRDRRYQMFANKIPRGNNCFICNENKLTGLENLPPGGHMVVAPYVTAQELGEPRGDLGSSLLNRPAKGNGGIDVKYTPNPNLAVDATINPDFSQIESDTPVIATNQRFAIYFPEKRPFFLEGSELFSTPIQAVYTRSITSPRWGARATGKFDSNGYTLLIAQDRGGGSVIIPSALGSNFADQDFSSTVAIGRLRHDFGGKSFVSFLGSTREGQDGDYNRVFGPDFQWKVEHDTITGQFLISDTRTPDRPDLSSEWNGQKLKSHAGDVWWSHSTKTWDFYTEYDDYGDGFRADNGFVPQVGYRNNYAELGYTWFPKNSFFSRFRLFEDAQYQSLQDGSELYKLLSFGFGSDGKFRSFNRWRYAYDTVRASNNQLFQRHQLLFNEQFSVSKLVPQVSLNGWIGQDVDYSNNHLGRGANINLDTILRPAKHIETELTVGNSWLTPHGAEHRVFTSQIEQLRITYTFNARMFLRTIIQNTRSNLNQALYSFQVDQHSGSLASQLLFAYKLNWQTVMYLGYSDLRDVLAENNDFATANRQFFFKLSYAFQR